LELDDGRASQRQLRSVRPWAERLVGGLALTSLTFDRRQDKRTSDVFEDSPDNGVSTVHQVNSHQHLSKMSEVAERVRSRTLPHLRTEVKDRFAELREELDPDDQALLILRINRKLSWNEIAHVMAENEMSDEAELKRATANLRQRFQKIKRTMRTLAEERGLLAQP
jgi:DNA-directed RNA polymerase specialized sigma24 family protein